MATVLLVEDDDQVRVLAESYLEEQGHEVLSAGTAPGALALLAKSSQLELLFTNVDLKGEIAAGIGLAHEAVNRRPNRKVLYTTERNLTDGMKARFVKNSAFHCRSESRSCRESGEGVGGIFGIAPAPAAIDANIDAGPVVDRQHRRNVDRRCARWRQIGSQGRSAKADNHTHANDSANDSTHDPSHVCRHALCISHDCGHINFTARA